MEVCSLSLMVDLKFSERHQASASGSAAAIASGDITNAELGRCIGIVLFARRVEINQRIEEIEEYGFYHNSLS